MTLRERQLALRRSQFVGRESELEAVGAALAGERATQVFLVHGPGGAGKSALLLELAARHPQALYIDARELAVDPSQVAQALAPAIAQTPALVLLDSVEHIAPLEGWLRETLIPSLPERAVLVLAGRIAPSASWHAVVGWGTLLVAIPLVPLGDTDSRALLARRGVPSERHDELVDFSRGHPLALCVAADALAENPQLSFATGAPPDLVQALLAQLVAHVPSEQHRAALEVAALVRALTEPLLAALIDEAPGPTRELFSWLTRLSFMTAGPRGLFPHDLVRELLDADLRWRAPERHLALLERAHAYYLARMERADESETRRLCLDWLFLARHAPLVGDGGWDCVTHLRIELAQPSDTPALCALAARHEGAAAAELLAYWLARQPAGGFTCRDPRDEIVGFALFLWLDEMTPADAEADPAVRAALRVIKRLGPLRAGERAFFNRTWMARDDYQVISPLFRRVMNTGVSTQVRTPSLRYHFFTAGDPDTWMPVLDFAGGFRIADGDFEVGGRRFGLFMLDYRAVRPLNHIADRICAASLGDLRPPVVRKPVTRLERPAFARAVQAALKQLNDPIALEASPLCDSRLAWTGVPPDARRDQRARALTTRLAEAIDALAGSARGARAHRALHSTYVQPTPVQKQAAADLGLTWTTYRRHLTEGVAMLVEQLWRREVGC
jgi:hypothetical protein